MIKKTLGGERLGSGNRMKVALHNYERSTHNLGNVFRTTATPGVLIPFYKKLALNGDTWTIKLASLVRTAPAIGPLFGSYKLQLDFFECPIRLYNGILHNNMLRIGMEMSKVKLPKMQITAPAINLNNLIPKDYNNSQVSSSALIKYLGVSGLASWLGGEENNATIVTRKFNAIPVLSYFDIFKNYYANKQEPTAWIMKGIVEEKFQGEVTNINTYNNEITDYFGHFTTLEEITVDSTTIEVSKTEILGQNNPFGDTQIKGIYAWQNDQNEIWIERNTFINKALNNFIGITYWEESSDPNQMHEATRTVWEDLKTTSYIDWYKYEDGFLKFKLNATNILTDRINNETEASLQFVAHTPIGSYSTKTEIEPFDLDDIDDMRIGILRETALNTEYIINDNKGIKPYAIACGTYQNGGQVYGQLAKMNGLLLKTYQADIFNAWLSKDWIDGINGINAITAVSTAGGSFTIDALNLANKVYDMLNRIAVSGGSYEDWQEAVFGEDALRRAESPIYCGGMSGHIMFEEVVSTADTQTQAAGDQPLGTLAGKGALHNVKGGNVEIHVKEPSYIIGIMSITPLVDYNQTNDFDMTELDSLNDVHKPALDQIGFQELLIERAAWFGTEWDSDESKFIQNSGGKTPAWIEYMTNVNKTYGEFNGGELDFMVLNRNYQPATSFDATPNKASIKDWTTYINPTKYNYQFANTDLTAQNFWVQIGIDAIVRRKMSAKVMPNL